MDPITAEAQARTAAEIRLSKELERLNKLSPEALAAITIKPYAKQAIWPYHIALAILAVLLCLVGSIPFWR